MGCSSEPPKLESVDRQNSSSSTKKPPSKRSKAEKYETPEAVFAAYQEAASKSDFRKVAECISDESQTVMAGEMIVVAMDLGQKVEEMRHSLDIVFNRHGIDRSAKPSEDLDLSDPRDRLKWAAEPVVDKPGCIADFINVIRASGLTNRSVPAADGTLKDLQVDDDRATAIIESQKPDQPVEFLMEDGSWRIHFPHQDKTAKS